jgi:hypothetical protein
MEVEGIREGQREEKEYEYVKRRGKNAEEMG